MTLEAQMTINDGRRSNDAKLMTINDGRRPNDAKQMTHAVQMTINDSEANDHFFVNFVPN